MEHKTKNLTEEHYSFEYLSKLNGKKITDSRMVSSDYVIKGVGAMYRQFPKQDFPSAILFLTNNGESQLDFLVAMDLIEKGKATDTFGFTFEIIN